MEWMTPKTDWKITYDENGNYLGDYFEAEDYKRMKNNLLVLKEKGEGVFSAMRIPELPDVTIRSYGYASYINAIEESLKVLVESSIDIGLPKTKVWSANSSAPLYSDLNRIESMMASLYELFNMAESGRVKLSFEMGGSEF